MSVNVKNNMMFTFMEQL